MINPPEQPINDEARNGAHTTHASTSVWQYLAHTQCCHIKNATGN